MDQDVVNLAKAIRAKESGGNFNAVGDAGTSKGGYQWQPATWKANAKSILGDEKAPMTPDNQNAVAYGVILKDKQAGLNPAQIAAKWNSGKPDGWENKIGTTTINGKKIPYNVPAYVKEVTDTYQKFKTASATPPETPTPEAPKSDALFPSKEGEGTIASSAKVIGNLLPSAFNFAKGALNTINPGEIAIHLGQIPGAFSALSKESGGVGNALKATAAELPGEAYKAVVPEAGRDILKGNFEQARQKIVNDPFGQIAPFVLAGRGLAGKADALASKRAMAEYAKKPFEIKTIPKRVTKYGDAFDNAMTKISGAVTRPVGAAFGKAGNIAESAMGQVTGLNPETIRQIKETPGAFTKEAKSTAGDRATLGQEVQSSLAKKSETLTETGKEYNPIRESKTPVNVKDNFVSNLIKETAGVDIKNGKIVTKGSATIRDATEVRALQNLLDLWDPIFKKKQLTPTEYLNFRTDLAKLSKFERQIGVSKPLENIAQIMRGKFNSEYRPQLKGLKALDEQFKAQKTELSTLSKGMVDRNGNLTDIAINRIANATGKGKNALLDRLEQTVPGITQKIKTLKAVEDIEHASGIKVGTYTRAALTGGAFLGGGVVSAIVAAVLTSPQLAVSILRKYGVLKNARVIKAVGNALRESAKIVNNPGPVLSPYLNKDVTNLKLKAGLGIEDVGKGDYLYHGTPAKNIKSISEKGLSPAEGDVTFFTPSEKTASNYGRLKSGGADVVLRINKTKLPPENFQQSGHTAVPMDIPPEALEIKTPDGWKPLNVVKKTWEKPGAFSPKGKGVVAPTPTTKIEIKKIIDPEEMLPVKDGLAYNIEKADKSFSTGPIDVVKAPEGYIVLDGRHRVVEAFRKGSENMDANILTKEEAIKKYKEDWPHIKEMLKEKPTLGVAPKETTFKIDNKHFDEAKEWLYDWQNSDSGIVGKIKTVPKNTETFLSQFKPKEPIKLYRGIRKNQILADQSGIESWTHKKYIAEGFAEGGKVVEKVIDPKDIIFDIRSMPASVRNDFISGVDSGLVEAEVLVRNQKSNFGR